MLLIKRYDLLDKAVRPEFVTHGIAVARDREKKHGLMLADLQAEIGRNRAKLDKLVHGKRVASGVVAFCVKTGEISVTSPDIYSGGFSVEPCGYALLTAGADESAVHLHRLRVSPSFFGNSISAVLADTVLSPFIGVEVKQGGEKPDDKQTAGVKVYDEGRIDGLEKYDQQSNRAFSVPPATGSQSASSVEAALKLVADKFPQSRPPTEMNIVYSP